jgi:hypothetical protein
MLIVWGLVHLVSWGCWAVAHVANYRLLKAQQQLLAANTQLRSALQALGW